MIAILIVLWAVPILACVTLWIRLADLESKEALREKRDELQVARLDMYGGRLSEHAETLEVHGEKSLAIGGDLNFLSDRIGALEARATFKPPRMPYERYPKAPAKKAKGKKP